MKKNTSRIIAGLLVSVILLSLIPLGDLTGLHLNFGFLNAHALAASGRCGKNAFWSFDAKTGTLTIDGSGKMYDYALPEIEYPEIYNSSSLSVQIDEGITEVANENKTDPTDSGSVSCASIDKNSGAINKSPNALSTEPFSEPSTEPSIEPSTEPTTDFFEETTEGTTEETTEETTVTDYEETKPESPFLFSKIKNLIVSDEITSIGDGAFCNCLTLENVTIGKNVAEIGTYAFYGCKSLKTLNYYADSASYSDMSFLFLNNLKELNIGENVKKIPDGFLCCCFGLTSVTIPEGVSHIGQSAFYGCLNLSEINLPDSIRYIGCEAFDYTAFFNNNDNWENNVLYIGKCLIKADCENLTGQYSVKPSTAVISDFSFYGCENLAGITIPDGVITIGNFAFCGCNLLSEIALPDSVERLGYAAFVNCDDLSVINMYGSIKSIGGYAFAETAYYNNADNWRDGVLYINDCLIKADNTDKSLYSVLPETKIIADDAFADFYNLKSIILPDSLIYIGGGSFNNTGIAQITIPDNVESIGCFAFAGCKALKSVNVGNSLKSIGDIAFLNCISLKEITIPQNTESVGLSSFLYCQSLEVLNYNAESITLTIFQEDDYYNEYLDYQYYCDKRSPFEGSSLTTVNFGDRVKIIPDYFLCDCEGITEIFVPDSVKIIGQSAFGNCKNLKNIFIGKNTERIGNNAFASCPMLSRFDLTSNNETELGENVFENSDNVMILCKENSYAHYYSKMHGIKFGIADDSNEVIFEVVNDILVKYHGDSEDVYVNVASEVGYGAFKDNENLKTVELSSAINRLYNKAFYNCSGLERIIIPQSVTSIGDNAFDGCDNTTVWCYAGTYAESYALTHGMSVEYIKLNLSTDNIDLKKSESVLLQASFNTFITNEELIWSSDNSSVACVSSDGVVIGYGKGQAHITATAKSGLYATCTVNVSENEIIEDNHKVNSVKINDVIVNYKQYAEIIPEIDSENESTYSVTFSSSDTKISTVTDNGSVYGAKKGNAIIICTVTDSNGNTVTDTCIVTVKYTWWQWIIKIVLFGWIWY